jgi:hypothetical protein
MPWRHMGEWRYSSAILELGTIWKWVVSFMPRPLLPHGTHWIGGGVGPRAGPDAVGRRNIPWQCRESNPGHPARSPSLYQLSYPGRCSACYLLRAGFLPGSIFDPEDGGEIFPRSQNSFDFFNNSLWNFNGHHTIARTVLEDICDKPIRIQSYCAVARLHGVREKETEDSLREIQWINCARRRVVPSVQQCSPVIG